MTRGEYNSGHKISAKKAVAIGKRLLETVGAAKPEAYAKRYRSKTRIGTTKSCSAALLAARHVAKSTGSNPEKPRFTIGNVKDFTNFCLASGGFEIC